MTRVFLQRMLPKAASFRAPIAACQPARCQPWSHSNGSRPLSLMTVWQPSFWVALIPKPLRDRLKLSGKDTQLKSKEWNPATYYIAMFMLIGSMSIHTIALKTKFDNFVRQSDVRIARLRDVVERLQRGEQVDVEKALGTGDAQKEQEWEEALKQLEKDDIIMVPRKKKAESPTPQPEPPKTATQESSTEAETNEPNTAASRRANFF